MRETPTRPDPPRYLTCDEAAEFLRLSARTLEKHRTTGGGPRFRKFGRIVRYTVPDLEAWAEARAFKMTSDPDYPALPPDEVDDR
jgi:molybdenum cofactor biosynthesis enzyme MoaA